MGSQIAGHNWVTELNWTECREVGWAKGSLGKACVYWNTLKFFTVKFLKWIKLILLFMPFILEIYIIFLHKGSKLEVMLKIIWPHAFILQVKWQIQRYWLAYLRLLNKLPAEPELEFKSPVSWSYTLLLECLLPLSSAKNFLQLKTLAWEHDAGYWEEWFRSEW